MCPTADNFVFVTETSWNSAYYGAMAVAAQATEAVQKKATEIAFPLRLWHLSRKMRDLTDLMENRPKTLPAPSGNRVDPHKAAEQLDSLLEAADDFYQRCRRAGYTNRTLTATQINHIRTYTETIRDFTDRLKLVLDPRTPGIFQRARKEREAHGTVPMSSVF